MKTQPRFHMLTASTDMCSQVNLSTLFFPVIPNESEEGRQAVKTVVLPSDEDISDALAYLFKAASREVKEFVKPEIVKKIALERDGVLYSKSRILEGQRFVLSGDLEESGILADQGIIIHTPVVERFSLLAYSIGQWIHEKVAKHS